MSPLPISKVTEKQNYAEMANVTFNYKVQLSCVYLHTSKDSFSYSIN